MNKKSLLLIGASGLMAVMFQNCAPNNFEFSEATKSDANVMSGPQDDTSGVTPVGDTYSIVQKSKRFESASKERIVDMVWVIDNSLSMKEEAANVRQNFAAFANSVANQTNLRVALISKRDSFSAGTHVGIPSGVSNAVQVDFLVHSFNPLLVAASATCPENVDAADEFCRINRSITAYDRVRGSLNSFFRPNSQKVFVFVSDDDSAAMARNAQTQIQYDSGDTNGYISIQKSLVENEDFVSADTFKKHMSRVFGEATSYKVFGFVALNNKATCASRVGSSYIDLIQDRKGLGFDICQGSWSEHFNSLSNQVIEYALNEYALGSADIHQVKSVALNGKVLIQNLDYSVDRDKITLNQNLVASIGNYVVDVSYEERVKK